MKMMWKSVLVFLVFFIAFVGFGTNVRAANLLIQDNVEEGSNWNVGTHWTIGEDRDWIVVSSGCHGGTFCLQSNLPNYWGGEHQYFDDDAIIGMFILPNAGWNATYFVRFWAKYPPNFTGTATDACSGTTPNGGADWARLATSGANWKVELWGGFSSSSGVHVYDDGAAHWGDYGYVLSKDNQWHEYAYLFKMESSTDANNGEYKFWKDASGNYSDANAGGIITGINFGTDYLRRFSFGHEYKGWCATQECSNCGPTYTSLFYFDDIEIWDGIPNAIDINPPSRSNPQPTGILSSGTTQTNISLETDVQAICRYSTASDTNYTDLPFNFTYTNSTNHSTQVTGLENGKTYIYYVRCNSSSGYVNEDDFSITFSVGGHKADLNDDGVINMKELISFIARWKASDGVTRAEVLDAREIWFTGGMY